MKILVTGSAGFIGFHLVNALLKRGDQVVGIDSINDYYDPELKFARLKFTGIEKEEIHWNVPAMSHKHPQYRFIRMRMEDRQAMEDLFVQSRFDAVVNLAAQAGVRYSLTNPHAYIDSNIVGFLHVLEGCRQTSVSHLVYASSSSVYGLNEKMPLSEFDRVDHPISLYAATKKSNEVMAHAYSHLYGMPTTGLRFFTAYGPWGRPDMALYLFTVAMMRGEKIKVFNRGDMVRDFTYVADIIAGVCNVIDHPAQPFPGWTGMDPETPRSKAPYRIYNIGNSSPVKLMKFIEVLEEELGVKAEKDLLPIQPGDVPVTVADVSLLEQDFNYRPSTSVEEGIRKFVEWIRTWEQMPV